MSSDLNIHRLRDALHVSSLRTEDWKRVAKLIRLIPSSVQGSFDVLTRTIDGREELVGLRMAPDAVLGPMVTLMEKSGKRPQMSSSQHGSDNLNARLTFTGAELDALLAQETPADAFMEPIHYAASRQFVENSGGSYAGTYTLAAMLRDPNLRPLDRQLLESTTDIIAPELQGMFLCDMKYGADGQLQLARFMVDPDLTLAQFDAGVLKPIARTRGVGHDADRSFEHLSIHRTLSPDQLFKRMERENDAQRDVHLRA